MDFFRRAPIEKRNRTVVSKEANNVFPFSFNRLAHREEVYGGFLNSGRNMGGSRTCGILPASDLEELLDI